jgi:hypothetical protein
MKSLVLLFALVSLNAFAVDIGGSFYEGIVNNMNDIDSLEADVTALQNVKKNVAVFLFDATVAKPAGAYTFASQKIPANSIISNVFYEVETQLVAADSNTAAFACGGTTLDTAANLTGVAANTIAAGDIVIQTVAGHKNVGAECTPTVTVGAGASGITAGKIRWFVEYVTRY